MDANMEEEELLSLIEELPDELIIKILSYLSPYTDTKQAKLVNRKWYRIITTNELHCKRLFYECIKSANIKWQIHKQRSYDIVDTIVPVMPRMMAGGTFRSKVQLPSPNVPAPRFSHASVILGQYLYVFGGSSDGSTQTNFSSIFNDLHRLNLATRTWQKVKTEGLLPAPRECCSLVAYKRKPSQHLYRTVPYKGKIVVFGGWCHPPADRVIIGPRFFDDTQIFHVHDSRWERLQLLVSPVPRAGHSASVQDKKMIIFGGSQRTNRLNDVWVFDLETSTWSCPNIPGKKPTERFGHAQFTLNERTIVIMGGCGGDAHKLFGDVWTLDTHDWRWTQVEVHNDLHQPPDLWCHDSVMVSGNIVVLSDEIQCPHCDRLIQNYSVPSPTHAAADDGEYCACGRLKNVALKLPHRRHFQMYVLDTTNLINGTVKWNDYQYLSPSPLSRRLFTANIGINEILLFGGIISDGADNSCILDDSIIILSGKT